MEYHQDFTWTDWQVVGAYLGITTLVGHLLKGKQSTIKDFFLGGRSLPWPAVSGSIIATEISGVTFIGVPGMVYAAGGDFTYLQWGIGSIIARILVGIFFVKVFYEREIYSPYDYMGNRLGVGAKRLAPSSFKLVESSDKAFGFWSPLWRLKSSLPWISTNASGSLDSLRCFGL